MARSDIAHHRLLSQRLCEAPLKKPDEVVGWLGAVQAQDYAGAKWALGLRLQGATDGGLRLAYIMIYAELEGVVCSGPRRGKQFTYALLDERAPHTKTLEHEEALAELAHRYFVSRGPATVQDFAKWSGSTITDARRGLEVVKSQLQHEAVDGQAYWFSKSTPTSEDLPPSAHLMSIYDEYISGYKDHSAIAEAEVGARLSALGNALSYIIVVDGRIVGTWKRTLKRDAVVIETNLFTRLKKAEKKAVSLAARQYGDFLERTVDLASV